MRRKKRRKLTEALQEAEVLRRKATEERDASEKARKELDEAVKEAKRQGLIALTKSDEATAANEKDAPPTKKSRFSWPMTTFIAARIASIRER